VRVGIVHLGATLVTCVGVVAGATRLVAQAPLRPGSAPQGRDSGRTVASAADSVYDWQSVDRAPVFIVGSCRARYPRDAQIAAVEGTVLIEGVVDRSGRLELASIRVVSSSHRLFTEAVRRVLPACLYSPGIKERARVRVRIQQPFNFTIRKAAP
jgi:TonB family protein